MSLVLGATYGGGGETSVVSSTGKFYTIDIQLLPYFHSATQTSNYPVNTVLSMDAFSTSAIFLNFKSQTASATYTNYNKFINGSTSVALDSVNQIWTKVKDSTYIRFLPDSTSNNLSIGTFNGNSFTAIRTYTLTGNDACSYVVNGKYVVRSGANYYLVDVVKLQNGSLSYITLEGTNIGSRLVKISDTLVQCTYNYLIDASTNSIFNPPLYIANAHRGGVGNFSHSIVCSNYLYSIAYQICGSTNYIYNHYLLKRELNGAILGASNIYSLPQYDNNNTAQYRSLGIFLVSDNLLLYVFCYDAHSTSAYIYAQGISTDTYQIVSTAEWQLSIGKSGNSVSVVAAQAEDKSVVIAYSNSTDKTVKGLRIVASVRQ